MSHPNQDGRKPGAIAAVALVGLLVMLAGVVFATINGALTEEFPVLMGMPWGMVAIIDLYVGLALIAGWIFWRERNPVVAVAWSIGLVFGGNIVTCAYVLIAMFRCRGDAHLFWHGPRAVHSERAAAGMMPAGGGADD